MPSNKQITDKISEIVRKLCEDNRVPLKSALHIPSHAAYEDCLAYAGYYYTNNADYKTLSSQPRTIRVGSRFKRMRDALKVGAPEPDKSLIIDIGCGPGLFMHAADAQATPNKIILYGYDHCAQMLELAKDIWNKRGLTSKHRLFQRYEDLVKKAQVELQSQSRHLIFTFGYVLAQIVRSGNKQALDDFAKNTADSIDALAQRARTCAIVAIDEEQCHTDVADFTEGLNLILGKSQLEWDAMLRAGYPPIAIWVAC